MPAPRKRLAKKWLDQIPPTASFSDAARETIDGRAATVLHYIPLAANRAHENVEYVHQMRVATRRACSAMEAFRGALPPKRAKRCHVLLKKVRRSSGRARDLDVMIDRLKHRAADEIGSDAKACLAKALQARRKAAQPRMRKALERIGAKSLAEQLAKLQIKIRWRGQAPEPDWKTASTHMLSRVAAGLFEAGKPLEGLKDAHDQIEDIHRLRIRGKELRYSMEIAVGAFGQPLRELYGFIEQTQTQLGIINDHAVALDFYRAWYDDESDEEVRQAINTIVTTERSGLNATLREFPEWWSGQNVGQFWQRWQSVVGPVNSTSSDSDDVNDACVQKRGA